MMHKLTPLLLDQSLFFNNKHIIYDICKAYKLMNFRFQN